MAHPFQSKELERLVRHKNYCADDNTPLEYKTIIAYTKQNPKGLGLPPFEYCPTCRKYAGYSGTMESDISKIVLEALIRNIHGFKPGDLKKVEILNKK
jgi:hypothetical protein